MKLNEDAYGKEIFAHLNGKKSFEIVERDDGYFDVSNGWKTYFSEFKDWHSNEKKAMKYVKGKVLDIGCGAGRHSLWLQKKGFDVLGIDNSPLAIKVCKLRELKKAKIMSIDDIEKFKPNSFDTIIMMGNNFGLLRGFNKARTLLKKMYKITSPHALIIAESNDPYKTDNLFHILYQKFNRKRGRMSGQMKIRIRFMKYVGKWFDYLIVSEKEMRNIIKNTGWEIKKIIKSKDSVYTAIIEKVIK